MLGLTRPDHQWLWAARGKHPSVSDYFSVGRDFPIAAEFSEWIKKGYAALAERDQPARMLSSWRFWARGTQKNDLVCGLLRDSHDSMGRPYPFMVIGAGSLPSWERSWENLPSACEKTWRQMEYLTIQKFGDLRMMETEILKTRPPFQVMTDCSALGGHLTEVSTMPRENAPMLDQLRKQVASESSGAEGKISIITGKSCDSVTLAIYISHVLKEQLQTAPNAVFMGGTFDKSWLVYFRRPMRKTDFMNLWLSGSVNGQGVDNTVQEGLSLG